APRASNTRPTPRPTRVPPASEPLPFPVPRFPFPLLLQSSRLELLRRFASQQVTRRIAFQAVADAAQIAYQATQFRQGRTHLREAVVGEAVDRGPVLVDDHVGAIGRRVQVRQ